MKRNLTLSIDRKSASEGEFINIQWNCDACPDSLSLTIDSGYKCDTIPVADNGCTRIAMSRSKGKTTVTLKAVISGRKFTESIDIRVKNIQSSSPVHSSGLSRFRLWKEKLQAKWYVFRAQLKYWWLSRKKWQKVLCVVILALWLWLLISAIGGRPDKAFSSKQVQTACSIR